MESTPVSMQTSQPILEVSNLKTYFFHRRRCCQGRRWVDFSVQIAVKCSAWWANSGCGKSVTSLSIMRLIGQPGKIVEGEILFEGKDLLKLPEVGNGPISAATASR